MTAKPAPLSDEQLKALIIEAMERNWSAAAFGTLHALITEHAALRSRVAEFERRPAPLATPITREVRIDHLADLRRYAIANDAAGMRAVACRMSPGSCFCGIHTSVTMAAPPVPCTCALADDSAPVGLHQAQCGVVLQWSAEREVATRFGGRF